MIKYYCDYCGKPTDDIDRVKRKLGSMEIEVIVTYKGVANSGHICQRCVIKAVREGERVKA
jgi:hypothetical protein